MGRLSTQWLGGASIAAVYFLLGKIGLGLALVNASASAVWPPAGFALAVVLLLGNRYWVAIFLGAFLVNMTTQGSVLTNLAIASGNTLEALVGAFLVKRFAGGTEAFHRVRSLFHYLLYAAILSTLISAVIGSSSLTLTGYSDLATYPLVLITWWLGDMVSHLMIAPLLICAWTASSKSWKKLFSKEAVAMFGGSTVLAWVIFAQPLPLAYFLILPVLLAAVRLGRIGALLIAINLSLIALYHTLHSSGPFAGFDPATGLLLAQLITAAMCVTALVSSAIISEQATAIELVRRNETLLTDFFENSAMALHWVGPDGKILRANQTELSLLGYTESEYIGHHIAEFHANSGVISDILSKLGCGETLDNYEAQLLAKDGSVRHVLISSNVFWEDGKFVHTRCFTRDITKQKLAEEGLRRSHDQFTTLVNHSPIGIYLVNSNLRILMMSEKARQSFGAAGSLVGQDLNAVLNAAWPISMAEPILSSFKSTLASGLPFVSVGFAGVRQDLGRQEHYDWQIHRITLPDGEYGVACYFVDTSSHVLAQQALRESDARLRAIFNQAAVGIAIASLEGWFLEMNHKFMAILGYSQQELLELTVAQITHPLDVAYTNDQISRLLRGEIEEFTAEKRYLRRDRSVIWSLSTVTLLRDPEGKPSRLIGVIEDITEKKQSDDAVRKTADRLKLALSAGQLGDWSWDASTDLVTLGQRAAEIFGVDSTAPITWASMRRLLHPDDAERARVAVEQSLNQHADYSIEYRVKATNDDFIWVAAKGKGIYSDEGAVLGMIGVVQDVDALRKIQMELESAMKTKDHFLATLSHELRTPLTPVVMTVSALLKQRNLPDPVVVGLRRIERNILTESRLIDDLLDLTRITQKKLDFNLELLNLHECIQESISYCSVEITNSGCDLFLDLDPSSPQIKADAKRLQQVFWNLIKNAVKFSPPGSKLIVRTQRRASSVEISFRDEGLGIPEAYLEAIFLPFEQGVRGDTGGMGLGLAICKSIINGMGGSISAQSAGERKGSTFIIQLPIPAPPAFAATNKAPNQEGPQST